MLRNCFWYRLCHQVCSEAELNKDVFIMKIAVVAREKERLSCLQINTVKRRRSMILVVGLWYCQQNLSAVGINHSKRLEAVLQMVMHVCSRS